MQQNHHHVCESKGPLQVAQPNPFSIFNLLIPSKKSICLTFCAFSKPIFCKKSYSKWLLSFQTLKSSERELICGEGGNPAYYLLSINNFQSDQERKKRKHHTQAIWISWAIGKFGWTETLMRMALRKKKRKKKCLESLFRSTLDVDAKSFLKS